MGFTYRQGFRVLGLSYILINKNVILILDVLGRDDLAATSAGNKDDPMNMVRHDDKGTWCLHREMNRNLLPPSLNDLTIFIQVHFFIHDFAEHTMAILRHNCDVICAF